LPLGEKSDAKVEGGEQHERGGWAGRGWEVAGRVKRPAWETGDYEYRTAMMMHFNLTKIGDGNL
jgi:hypothetical protein